jgi:hypothetical protein
MAIADHQLDLVDVRVAEEGQGGEPNHGCSAKRLILLWDLASNTAAGTGGDDHDGGGH